MSFDFSTFHSQAEKAVAHIQKELAQLRTGKASAQMLDPVRVEAYGGVMGISEVASVSVNDNCIFIKPWDRSLLEAIEKAIASSSLQLPPVVDKDEIRVVIPPLTEERRKDMVKVLHQKIEQGRVLFRTIRSEIKKDIEEQKGLDNISEDDITIELEQLDTEHKKYLLQIDQISEEKEKELMTV